MPKKENPKLEQRVRLTVHLTLTAYDAIRELQRIYRTQKGRALPIWEAIDISIKAYARENKIKTP